MSKHLEELFSIEEEDRIIQSIRKAETTTSGEIRVHISQSKDNDALEATKQIFHELNMFKTKDRNAVLFHISMASKSFAIYGDKGIDAVVPSDFWESTVSIVQAEFKEGNLVEGICKGVAQIGEQLKTHFPWNEDDVNELSDDISYD